MIEWKVDSPKLKLGLGNSVEYQGDADLVFTELYGPLPQQLSNKPAIINLYGRERKEQAEQWLGPLQEVGTWGSEQHKNYIYISRMNLRDVEIGDLVEFELAPNQGVFPIELPMRLLKAYAPAWEITVFDGYMGRGTVGKAALELGMKFVGIDILPVRVDLAKYYLC